MKVSPRSPRTSDFRLDAEVGHRLVEVKLGATGLRAVRTGLMDVACALSQRPDKEGFLVLSGSSITPARLEHEWQAVAAVLHPALVPRLTLCLENDGAITGIPRTPDPETQRILLDVVQHERAQARPRSTLADAPFVIRKVLIHHWLTDGRPVTVDWLGRTSGYTYPTVAAVLHDLGSLIERSRDRRVRLRWFPDQEFMRLVAMSDRARDTVRYLDRSGEPRSPETHLQRLANIAPAGVAIGGVLGAKHYCPDLDLVGLPRLDLSVHSPRRHPNLRFVERLDPGLRRVEDPVESASLAIHVLHHAAPLFTPRVEGLNWADPVECLLDLHEAHLPAQAAQLLHELQRKRPTVP